MNVINNNVHSFLFAHVADLWHLRLHSTFLFLQAHRFVLHCILDRSQEHVSHPCPPSKDTFPAISRRLSLLCGTVPVNVVDVKSVSRQPIFYNSN